MSNNHLDFQEPFLSGIIPVVWRVKVIFFKVVMEECGI